MHLIMSSLREGIHRIKCVLVGITVKSGYTEERMSSEMDISGTNDNSNIIYGH